MSRFRLLSAGSCALLLLMVQAGGVLAQTPAPIERTPEMEEHAAEVAALFPDEIAGASLVENLEINIGQEIFGTLDPNDPDDAAELAQFEEIVAAVGATLDDVATATSYTELDDGSYAFVIAVQARGADIGPAVPLFVAALEEDMLEPIVEQGQVGDVEVTLFRSAENPDGDANVMLARGDVLWLLTVPAELLEEVIGSLPES